MSLSRTEKGRWVKGTSGNPGGRGRDSYLLSEAAKLHGPKAVETLAALMVDKNQSGAVRLGAAVALLDRGFGKPQVSIEARVETSFDASREHLEALRQLANGDNQNMIDVTPMKA